MLAPFLSIGDTDKGRGVFTSKNIAAGTIIETSPVIDLSVKERKQIEGTKLYHYIFEWGYQPPPGSYGTRLCKHVQP